MIWLTGCSNEQSVAPKIELPVFEATVYHKDNSLKVRYDLPEPKSELVFLDRDFNQRNAGWSVPSNFAFDGKNLKHKNGEAFSTVVFSLERDPRFFNRRYVVIDSIGQKSWSLFLPAFGVQNGQTHIYFKPENNLTLRIGSKAYDSSKPYVLGEQDLMAYYGQPQFIKESSAIIIAGPDIPEWLTDHVKKGVDQTMLVLEQGFDLPPEKKPTIYITTGSQENGKSTKGGQLDEAVMTFRYRGFNFSEENENIKSNLDNTSSHEATHLWIGGRFKNIRNEEEPWMSEGGTEYLADRTRNPQDKIVSEFEYRLNQCLMRIGTQPLDGSKGPVHGYHVYDCGFVLHGAAESTVYQETGADIMDIWLHMIQNLKTEDQSYLPSDFLNSVNAFGAADYDAFADLFLTDDAVDRWGNLPDLAKSLGIELELNMEVREKNTQAVTGHWLMPLLAANCRGSRGFYNNSGAKRLGVEDCDKPLEDGLDILSVNNTNLITEPLQALEKVTAICTDKGDLVFTTKDGQVLPPIKCNFDLPPLPPAYKVTGFPKLPRLNTIELKEE